MPRRSPINRPRALRPAPFRPRSIQPMSELEQRHFEAIRNGTAEAEARRRIEAIRVLRIRRQRLAVAFGSIGMIAVAALIGQLLS